MNIDNKYVYDIAAMNIRRIRKEKGLTQAQLADLTGYNEGSLANIENRSEATFSLELLYIVAASLNTPLKEFFINEKGEDI